MSREARQLKKDLRDLGATPAEAAELTHAAQRLTQLHVPGLTQAGRERVAARVTSRIPVDVGSTKPARSFRVSWAVAGSFALVLLVAVAVFVVPNMKQHSQAAEHTHEPTQKQQVEDQLQQQIQQLQTLQEQPTVDDQAVQKAKDDFSKTYQQYQQLNTDQKTTDPYSNYQQQWWWPASSGAASQQSSAPIQVHLSASQDNQH